MRARAVRFNTPFGIVYGFLLAAISSIAAGAGHGTYIPAMVSSAPLGVLGIPASLLGAPVLWGAFGALAVRRSSHARTVVLVHYAGVMGVLAIATVSGNWVYFATMAKVEPWLLPLWALLYLGGQVAAWRTLVRKTARRNLRSQS